VYLFYIKSKAQILGIMLIVLSVYVTVGVSQIHTRAACALVAAAYGSQSIILEHLFCDVPLETCFITFLIL
jgi:uncharacterized membrane protein (Fun14 family)